MWTPNLSIMQGMFIYPRLVSIEFDACQLFRVVNTQDKVFQQSAIYHHLICNKVFFGNNLNKVIQKQSENYKWPVFASLDCENLLQNDKKASKILLIQLKLPLFKNAMQLIPSTDSVVLSSDRALLENSRRVGKISSFTAMVR